MHLGCCNKCLYCVVAGMGKGQDLTGVNGMSLKKQGQSVWARIKATQ